MLLAPVRPGHCGSGRTCCEVKAATMDCAAISSAENTWMLKMKSCAARLAHCQGVVSDQCRSHKTR